MALTNSSRLADFGSGIGTAGAIIQIDNANQRVGIGTTNPQTTLQVVGIVSATSFSGNVTGTATGLSGSPNITVGTIAATSLNASGVVTATSFVGSGANLTGVISGVEIKSEGTLFIVPSYTLHYATPNLSNKTRTVISADLLPKLPEHQTINN